jgi:hypothetical protein
LPVTPALARLRSEDCEFKANLSYIAQTCQRKKEGKREERGRKGRRKEGRKEGEKKKKASKQA